MKKIQILTDEEAFCQDLDSKLYKQKSGNKKMDIIISICNKDSIIGLNEIVNDIPRNFSFICNSSSGELFQINKNVILFF